MPYTITITNDSPQALDFVKFIKNLDFVKVTKIKENKRVSLPAEEVLEEDENGIPLKFKDKIMAMSKQANRNMTKRWESAIAEEEQQNI
nr:glutaredoxin-2 domain protein [uncultured Capnocytophaga sp.]